MGVLVISVSTTASCGDAEDEDTLLADDESIEAGVRDGQVLLHVQPAACWYHNSMREIIDA